MFLGISPGGEGGRDLGRSAGWDFYQDILLYVYEEMGWDGRVGGTYVAFMMQ